MPFEIVRHYFFVKVLSDLRYGACRQCCGLLEDKAVIEWLTESGVGWSLILTG